MTNDENDYINASPIQLGTRRYIAAQGPRSNTVNHFYRMLATEARSPVIVVMLTSTHENGVEKCFPYFPGSKADSPFPIPGDEDFQDNFQGSIILEDLIYDPSAQSQIRHLCMRVSWDGVTFQELKIVHMLFEAWPDHAAPNAESREALVEFIRTSASRQSTALNNDCFHDSGGDPDVPFHEDEDSLAPQSPAIVHCSAGCGRTGTFIALDYLLSVLNAGGLDNVPPDEDPVNRVVGDLRRQRMVMVQKEEQFQFIYQTLRQKMEVRQQQQQRRHI